MQQNFYSSHRNIMSHTHKHTHVLHVMCNHNDQNQTDKQWGRRQ